MKKAKVLIIIVTFNKKEYVLGLLRSLQSLSYEEYDIVVVDNASSDGTVGDLKDNFPKVHIIENQENNGGSGGFNTGLAYAFQQKGYQYYWLLDNDVEVDSDALLRLVDVLENNPDIGVAGSQMCQLDNPGVTNEIGAYVDFNLGGLVLHRHLTRKINNQKGCYDVDYVAAASLLVRAEVAQEAGLWEDLFIHFDDVDWCLTIRKLGHRVVGVAESVIWHLSAAEKPITWAMYYDVRNMLFLLQKHGKTSQVKKFAHRKILQALQYTLQGLTPMADLIFDGLDDFLAGKKGGKKFHLPPERSKADIQATHPKERVLLGQNEWFDPHVFPCDKQSLPTIERIFLSPCLVDAVWSWQRRGKDVKISQSWFVKILSLGAAYLGGWRPYRRAYVDLRYAPFMAAVLAEDLLVHLGRGYWQLNRRPREVWKKNIRAMRRALRLVIRFSKEPSC